MKQLFKDKKYWREMGIILLFGILINIACFCMPMITHAQGVDGTLFPFYINEIYGANGTYNGNTIQCDDVSEIYHTYYEQYKDNIISDIYDKFSLNTSDSILVRIREQANNLGSSTPYLRVVFEFYVNPTVNGTVSTTANFVNTPVDISFDYYGRITYKYYPLSTNFVYDSKNNLSTSNGYTMFGTPSIYHLNYSTYDMYQIYNYPVFMHNMEVLYSSNGTPLIAYTGLSIGDFSELPPIDEVLNNIQNSWEPPSSTTGHALPNEPTENPNNTPFQDRLQMFNYIKDTINSVVGNLGYNLKNWFDNLIGKIVQGFNSVSSNIHNGFSTLMQNIKDFFGAKLDAIIDLLSQNQNETQEEINNALDNTSMHEDLSGLHTLVSDSLGVWSDTSTPNEYKIPLHLEQISILHVEKCQYIDVGLFSPVFPYLRGVMWCLLVYSVIYTVIDSIASYIGGGDE